jgi:hypothetical protein
LGHRAGTKGPSNSEKELGRSMGWATDWEKDSAWDWEKGHHQDRATG